MSSEKVKVFALAKRYGFKSSKFVEVLRSIGFPVTSYQASVDTWDVPVIEERMLKGGLIEPSQATTIEAEEPETAKEEKAAEGWKVVVKEAPPAEEEPAFEEEVAAEEPEVPEPVPASAAEAVAEPEPEPEEPEEMAEEPVPVEEPEPIPVPLPVASETVETAEPVSVAEAVEAAEPVEAEPVAEAPEPEPVVAEAAAEPVAGEAEPAEASAEEGATATEPPQPKPRAGARKVGKIDLAALGLVKAQHARGRKNITFTDIRDRESTRRREQRTRIREKQKTRKGQPRQVSTVERKSDVVLEQPITVKSFSTATGIGVSQVLGKLMGLGTMANINAIIDEDTVELLAAEFDISVRLKQEEDIEESLMSEIQEARQAVDDSKLVSRPPVIAFMGHVDHGKTSLIDAIRDAKVAAGEAGGITQHIGAYTVQTSGGHRITIIDTPGHEAFTAMRARGASTTDIAILVVAADDGVKPQTEEAANHAKEAGVPVIVALNKVDAPGANPDKVKAELAGLGLQPEEWGGNTGIIETSALRKTGLDELLERISLEAEVLELSAHKEGEASGVVLEAMVSEGKGKVAHLLVQDGTLRPGDVLLAGQAFGKVRRVLDHRGKPIKSAGPSTPVEVLGLNELPSAGERFYVVGDMMAARDVAEKRQQHLRETDRAAKAQAAMADIFDRMEDSTRQRIRLVVKADFQGTLEVLQNTLPSLSSDEVVIDLVHTGVGAITESDVDLATTAGATVIGFNVAPDSKASQRAEKEGIEIRRYNVIYELTEDLEKAMLGLLEPEAVEEVTGHLEVLQVFRSSRFGAIAGCNVLDGEIRRTCRVRVSREGTQVHEGELESLRRFKDDVREVKAGNECGIRVKDFDDVQPGDQVEAFEIVQKARTLEDVAGAS